MIIQQAIKLSIEGGFEVWEVSFGENSTCSICSKRKCRCRIERELMPERKVEIGELDLFQTLLDPSFWQSLGKSMGWSVICYSCFTRDCGEGKFYCEDYKKADMKPEWLYHWHRFINHLAEGKDINSFFESLTN